MDVHLLVYDLSGGMARSMSMQFLGFQLDAIYHTSIELQGREYVYDGGIVSITPGSSHLGRPMERLHLGKTELSLDVVEEYLDSVRSIFTAEAYDLFKHNCNNFTDSFSNFLIGKGIPNHISNMPEAVMNSPMGQMLMPMLTQSVNARRGNGLLGLQQEAQRPQAPTPAAKTNGHAKSSHPHASLKLPAFSSTSSKPVTYAKIPPLDKLLAKMKNEQLAHDPTTKRLKDFIEDREAKGASEAVVPDLASLSIFLKDFASKLPRDTLFAFVDLIRCALVDPRVSGYFAEEKDYSTIKVLLFSVNEDLPCPYALRLVTLQAACNLFTTPLFAREIFKDDELLGSFVQLVSSSFLDEGHNNVRVAASSLLYNIGLAHQQARKEGNSGGLPEGHQIELAASVVEAIGQEEKSPEAMHGMLLALGHLYYESSLDGELADLLRALDAQGTVLGKQNAFADEKLIQQVGGVLLGKGLEKSS